MFSRVSGQLIYKPTRVYAPDGKDHSLSCDAKYEILVKHNAKIEKSREWIYEIWDINIDYTALPDTPGLRRTIDQAIDYWNLTRRNAYLMNTLTEAEYLRYVHDYNSLYDWNTESMKRTEEWKKKKEGEQKREAAQQPSSSSKEKPYTNDSTDEFDRLQVISEYGW